MQTAFEILVTAKELWLPALRAALGTLSAARSGRMIESDVKRRLGWLAASESEKAFSEAFTKGIEGYSTEHGNSLPARSAARILADCAQEAKSRGGLLVIFEQIFSDGASEDALVEVVSRRAVVLEDALVSPAETAGALLCGYLRPAPRAHPYFAERVGFAEMTALLRAMKANLAAPPPDLEMLEREYRAKVAALYEIIPMQGISPKVQNQTVGIRMEDVFVPLKARPEGPLPPEGELKTIFPDRNLVAAGADVLVVDSGEGTVLYQTKDFPAVSGAKFRESLSKRESDLPGSLFPLRAATEDAAVKALGAPSTYLQPYRIELSRGVGKSQLLTYPEYFHRRGQVAVEKLLDFPRFIVQGHPGRGKSTLVHYIAWALAGGRTEIIGSKLGACIPIVVRAIELGEALEQGRAETLKEYLAEKAGRFMPLFKSAIVSGNSILLIDGADEVSKSALRSKVKQVVDEFIADPAFTQNRMIVTTRIVGYERTGLTGQFPHFTISDLGDDQIRTFTERWYRAIERKMPGGIDAKSEANELFEAITSNGSIHRMARNPLLLTIIALIKWQGRALPDQRVLLYEAATHTLVKSWPLVQRGVDFDELFIREWMAPVAVHMLADRTGDLIDEYSLMEELVATMRRLRSRTETEARSESRELLDSISQHSGFLLPRGTDADGRNLYGFLHQTFAEFLAAYALAGRWEDRELDLRDYAHDPYWREVLLLMAGHLGTQRRAKAGHLIEAVRSLKSSPYEHLVHRDLLLACQILGDGVPAGPANVIESLLSELLSVWTETLIKPLREDIKRAFEKLGGTEYAAVAARLGIERKPSVDDTLALARALGPELFEEQLLNILDDQHQPPSATLRAAEMLFPSNTRVADVLEQLATNGDEMTRFGAVRLLIDAEDGRGIAHLKSLLKTSRAWILGKPTSLVGCRQPAAAEAVASWLGDPDLRLAANAAALLTQWEDKRGPEAFPHLALSADKEVRGTIWTTVRDARPGILQNDTLAALLHVPDLQLRLLAGHQLALRDDPRGVEALANLLDAPDVGVRLTAAIRLNEQNDPRAIPAFIKLLSVLDKGRIFYATGPLAKRSVPEGLAALRDLISDRDPILRVQAASQLLESGHASAESTLVDSLAEGGTAASIAFQALAKWGKIPLPELSAKLLKQPDPGLAWVVMQVLSQREDAEALDILIQLLDDGRAFVRAQAAEILISRKEPDALHALKQHLDGMLRETLPPPDPRTPASVSPPAESAYNFLKRYLTPAGTLPDWRPSDQPHPLGGTIATR